MPWVIGIDEAGYGPNLGPLVQAAVALYLPDEDPAGWKTLKPVARRCGEKADGRLLIDDSKKVNQGDNGLAKLEAGVLGALAQTREPFATVIDYLSTVALGDSVEDLHTEESDPIEHRSRDQIDPSCRRMRHL